MTQHRLFICWLAQLYTENKKRKRKRRGKKKRKRGRDQKERPRTIYARNGCGGAHSRSFHGNGHQLNRMDASTSPCLFYDDWKACQVRLRQSFFYLPTYLTTSGLPAAAWLMAATSPANALLITLRARLLYHGRTRN